MKYIVNNKTIELKKGDIVQQDTDAIVNAANEALVMGGGVAGAILRAGGYAIQKDCHSKAPIKVGEAAITTAGVLKAKHVIHAVGPRLGEGNEDEKLKNATLNSLITADRNNLKSISFPAISTGIFGYPVERCSKIMLKTTIEYLSGKTVIDLVVFVLFTQADYDIFEKTLMSITKS